MVLDHRDVDHPVGGGDRLEHLPRAENGAAEVEGGRAGAALVGGRGPRLPGRGLDARAGENPARVVAGVVGHHHRSGAGGEALPHQLGDQLGVGVGGLLGRPVPGAVGLDGDALARPDEGLDASQRREGAAEVGRRPLAAGGCQTAPGGRVGAPVPGSRQGRGCRWLVAAGSAGEAEAEGCEADSGGGRRQPLPQQPAAVDGAVGVDDRKLALAHACSV